MHNAWLRKSDAVQAFLKQHGIKGKRTIQHGLFSCVIVLSQQKVLKVTVDIYSYMLYLHLAKQCSANIPKLYQDYGCIGYVENPSCSEEPLPVVCYEMENIPQSCLYQNSTNVSKEHHTINKYCLKALTDEGYIYDRQVTIYLKSLDSSVASTLAQTNRYIKQMKKQEWFNKQLAKKGIKRHQYRVRFEWDIHSYNFAIHKNQMIFLDMIKESRLCDDMPG